MLDILNKLFGTEETKEEEKIEEPEKTKVSDSFYISTIDSVTVYLKKFNMQVLENPDDCAFKSTITFTKGKQKDDENVETLTNAIKLMCDRRGIDFNKVRTNIKDSGKQTHIYCNKTKLKPILVSTKTNLEIPLSQVKELNRGYIQVRLKKLTNKVNSRAVLYQVNYVPMILHVGKEKEYESVLCSD